METEDVKNNNYIILNAMEDSLIWENPGYCKYVMFILDMLECWE